MRKSNRLCGCVFLAVAMWALIATAELLSSGSGAVAYFTSPPEAPGKEQR
jgi:hypothetical protein